MDERRTSISSATESLSVAVAADRRYNARDTRAIYHLRQKASKHPEFPLARAHPGPRSPRARGHSSSRNQGLFAQTLSSAETEQLERSCQVTCALSWEQSKLREDRDVWAEL
jgi:hypothetical protein